MRKTAGIIAIALFAIASCSGKAPLDEMQPGERGRVVRVIDGDALVLDTGQSVRLVGVEAPSPGGRYGDGEPYARESARMLEDMVMGREVRLYYPGLTRDRYDRALAHLKTADAAGPTLWVNLQLVKRGAVRVRLYPDTDRGGAFLLEAERKARETEEGLWAESAYAIRPAGRIGDDARGFMLVDATLGEPTGRPGEEERTILCSRTLQEAGLVLDIAFSAREACDLSAGTRVHMRGWVSSGRMELVHPLHIEKAAAPERD